MPRAGAQRQQALRSLRHYLLMVAVALLAIAATEGALRVRQATLRELVLHDRDVGRLGRRTLLLLAQREAELREVSRPGDAAVALPAPGTRAALAATLDSLVAITAGNPAQHARARQVRAAAARVEAAHAAPRDEQAAGTTAPTLAPVRERLAEFGNVQAVLFDAQLERERRFMDRASLLVLAEVLLLTMVFYGLGRRVLHQAERLLDQQTQLEHQAQSLEEQAAELEHQLEEGQELTQELELANEALGAALEQLERERELTMAAERRFRGLVEHASELVSIVDADGVLRYASPAHERVLGFRPDELVGRPAREHLHPDDLPTVVAFFQTARRNPGLLIGIEFRYAGADGSWHQMLGSGINLLHDPAIGGIVMNAQDVTERQQLQEQLQQAQKMEAIGRLAGGIAHDFNNLLTVIRSYAELLQLELTEAGAPRSEIVEIQAAADRAAALTRQLLSFSRKQVLRPRVLDLNVVVGGVEAMLRRLIGREVTLEIVRDPAAALVEADASQLEQVILNLAINAADAMPAGGRLTIQTDLVELDAEFARVRAGLRAGPHVMLTVRDTGAGMDADTVLQIFEPFFTTKEPGKGTGLGLATVYGIVRQSRGHVAVESVPGYGTTFRVFLPRAADAAPLPRPVAAVTAPQGAETILLVEDEDAVRAVLRRLLVRRGFTVLEAEHGAEALAVSEEHDGPIDLVITDLMMPEMGGRELVQRLAARRVGLRVLFMSGYTTDELMRHGAVGPYKAFIQKPFALDEIADRIRQVLDGPAEHRASSSAAD
ncbi:MAG TPA: response regulator [Gemmatimonadaceae bacterium]|nr:response regulator [Gemmatimonadaceae bacterium]